ncbi:MAG: NAD(P)-binding domain-containing protein [Chitinophaga sp.]|uniref:NADPH-dependent F420 reductase n=1 Tax=Chitinophaga sp. TaxID=1869181 RepID=UPI001B2146CD|nr:NAD(P)-binding domain-containing protein [Chitinophaga sp.]MBO9730720.1 NAD(P)-binding domain-containing protein [Chitinophaga sp.]
MKKVGVLGTGMVGNTIATKLIQLGYHVMMGSRTADNEKGLAWANANGADASTGTFATAAAFGEILFNCTQGEISLEVMKQAGVDQLRNKILIDVSNPLQFIPGKAPVLIPELCNTNSLGEALQQFLPDTQVVKTLNIVNCEVMVDASKCGGEATMLLAGNNAAAKATVTGILQQFGWSDIIDLGNIEHARSTEMMLPVWLSIYMATKNGHIAFKIVR